MNPEIIESLPGLDLANAELDRLMAADAAEEQPAGKPSEQSATEEGNRAAQVEEIEKVPDQSKDTTEAPSTADPDKSKVQSPESKVEDKATADKSAEGKTAEPSKYAKNRERQDRSWAALNAEKDTVKAEREKLESDRAEFEQQRQEAELQYSPENYEAAAKRFEAEGKFDLAELAKKKAEQLRANPPKPGERVKAAQAKTEATRREWALKAGVDFPEIAKDNSPLQVRVAQLFKEEPDLKAHPKGIYLAARIAHLETAAARASAVEKELVQARARIKEFEEMTAPAGQGAATRLAGEKSFEQKSDEEQYNDLQEHARSIGSLV